MTYVNPAPTRTYGQVLTANNMQPAESYEFGTQNGANVQSTTDLAKYFNPGGGMVGLNPLIDEWEKYQNFNSTNHAFVNGGLNLTATIPNGGGLFKGGINSGQIWSKSSYQPGTNGVSIIGISINCTMPRGQGAWPACWLYETTPLNPPHTPNVTQPGCELDIFEFENTPNGWTPEQFSCHGHGPGVGGVLYSLLNSQNQYTTPYDLTAGTQKFALIWTPDQAWFYFNDEPVYGIEFAWTAENNPAQYGVNLACGTSNPGQPGLQPTSLSEFPMPFQVQFLHVKTA